MIGGRYRLEQRIGVGGMAEVWVALDTQLDRRVAVKLLGARKWFQEETGNSAEHTASATR